MNFYSEWAMLKDKGLDDSKYIMMFLNEEDSSLEVLNHGEENDVKFACELLLSIPVERFIELIGEDYEFSSKDVL